LSKASLFHEVINGNNHSVNDVPTAARNSYPVETSVLRRSRSQHNFQQANDSDMMVNLAYWK